MPGKPRKPTKHADKALPEPSTSNTSENGNAFAAMVGKSQANVVYGLAMTPLFGENGRLHASAHGRDVINRMAPRDAAEEMLVAQLLFAHARVMRLTEMANRQTDIEAIRVYHEYADRASNTYRRLMLALAEYRQPPRTGDTFAVVKQANIAGQQVIQNHEIATTNATNEQGLRPNTSSDRSSPANPAALPADTGRVSFPAFNSPTREAVEAVHRPQNARRQDPFTSERDEAR